MGELDLTGSGAEPLREDDPRQIGGIPLAGRLGAGGMGRVYLGVHEGRYVAVKQVLPAIAGEDQDFVRRFGHELDNLSRLPAEATAPLIASDRDARPPWLATAYVPGLTLNEALDLHRVPLPAGTVWLLLREAAKGLVPVHALSMVHRDLKPSNVMLTLQGVTLIDFGVARAAEQSQLTRSGMVVGTPAYMAPEQATTGRDLSGAADVFGLGSVIAYAAAGRPPFGEESGPAVLYRIVHEEPDLRAVRETDPVLADLIASCLAKDPEDRPTASELVRLASEHVPFTPPLWPESVTASLTAKSAFAAHVQEIELPPPASMETMSLGAKSHPKRERRKRFFFAVVPVVVTVGGATLAFQLLPYVFDGDGHAAAGPSASVSASAYPTASATAARPSGSAKPGASPTGRKKDGSEAADEEKGGGATDRSATPAPGAGSGDSGGSGASDGSGGAGSGGSASGGSGGSGSGASGGSGSGGSTVPSGTRGFRNDGNGECLVGARFVPASTGDCGGANATWTVRPLSDGSGGFQLVEGSGKSCLAANVMNGGTLQLSCNEAASRRWRSGAGNTLVSEDNGGCLDAGGSGVTTARCSGAASQRWTGA
ncbi:protein kinase domain-containing protein [Streptomyces sp. bgisy091]|uniref:serine/threonine-protein kinase n=1 Tax=Streptomyces sp. bgisy091 TaxID=3413778 RepID=UPI003D72E3D6